MAHWCGSPTTSGTTSPGNRALVAARDRTGDGSNQVSWAFCPQMWMKRFHGWTKSQWRKQPDGVCGSRTLASSLAGPPPEAIHRPSVGVGS
jgi:hypothetical protein